MEKLRTSLTIIRHSLGVMIRHPRLLIFPLVSLAAAMLIYAFFFVPMLFDKSLAETWQIVWSPGGWESIAPWHVADEARGSPWRNSPFELVLFYLLGMFVTTFVNVALYSQIIAAMNGGQVSVRRGLALACAKLPAIAAWSLLAGTVGVLLRAIQERVGFLGKLVAGLAGLSWSAASVFVIPIIINEPGTRNPVDYLKISAALLKRVWGEGLIGLSGVWLVGVLLFVPLFAIQFVVVAITGEFSIQIAYLTSLASLVIFTLLYLAYQIFECGMYVYATEGVAPGTFDEAIFDRAWTVKGGGAGNDPQPPVRRRVPWAKFWVVIPVLSCCVWIWLTLYLPPYRRVTYAKGYFGNALVDLADLGYDLDMEDLHAAGLFVGDSCWSCRFSPGKFEEELFVGKDVADLQATMFKSGDHLYVHFYGKDAANGPARIQHSLDLLRARFPGHEGAITFMRFTRKPD